jgi:hypothetical protein
MEGIPERRLRLRLVEGLTYSIMSKTEKYSFFPQNHTVFFNEHPPKVSGSYADADAAVEAGKWLAFSFANVSHRN